MSHQPANFGSEESGPENLRKSLKEPLKFKGFSYRSWTNRSFKLLKGLRKRKVGLNLVGVHRS